MTYDTMKPLDQDEIDARKWRAFMAPQPGQSSALPDAVARIEHMILSHTGQDVFEEVLKLLFAKLYDEVSNTDRLRFRPLGTAEETSEVVNRLFAEAKSVWPGVLPTEHRLQLPVTTTHEAVVELYRLSLTNSSLSILDAVLERLLTRAAKGAMGQYFTPRNVVACCVDVLAPGPEELVLDPACGSGGFLVAAIQHGLQTKRGLPITLGIDFDTKAFQVAQLMSAIVGENRVTLSRRNSLDRSAQDLDGDSRLDLLVGEFANLQVDVVLTNPPFGGEITDPAILYQYQGSIGQGRGNKGRKTSRELVFIERCIQLLRPGGRAAIVVPQGVTANASLRSFREWILDTCHLLGVVGLHPYTFLPHTGVKASVMFLERRTKSVQSDEQVFFAISEQPGKDSSGRFLAEDGISCYGNGDDLRAIAGAFTKHLRDQGNGWAYVLDQTHSADGRAAAAATVRLSQVRRSGRFDAEYFDPSTLRMVHQLKRAGAKPMRQYAPRVPSVWHRRGEKEIDYVDISSVDQATGYITADSLLTAEVPTRATFEAEVGDVLISTVRPERNVVGLVTYRGPNDLIATNGFCLLRPSGISSELLFAYCKTEIFRAMLTRCATATMYPAVTDKDVLDTAVPTLPSALAEGVESNVRTAHYQLHEAHRLIAEAVEALDKYLRPFGGRRADVSTELENEGRAFSRTGQEPANVGPSGAQGSLLDQMSTPRLVDLEL